jgi:type IV secretion system protein VirD4
MALAMLLWEWTTTCNKPKPVTVRLSNAVHTAIFAPTGVGKGVSCVVPFLLTTPEPCFVLDVKDGELARLTGETRRSMGRKVHIMDPYHCVTNAPATLNPVQFIDKNSPYALDDSRDIAAEIVERSQEKGDGVHFLDNAEAGIAAAIATVVEYGEAHEKSLQAVCDIVSSPEKWAKAIALMTRFPAQGGMLARMGGNLRHLKDREGTAYCRCNEPQKALAVRPFGVQGHGWPRTLFLPRRFPFR